MSLKNSFHTQLAIGILISDEKTLESKLDLLTAISVGSTSKETFDLCEGFRERLCDEEIQEVREKLLRDSKTKRVYKSNSRQEELNEVWAKINKY
jgi:hypothetical protein